MECDIYIAFQMAIQLNPKIHSSINDLMRKFDVRLKESSSNHKKKSIIKSILMEDDSARFQENINKIATEMERILIKNSRRPAKTIHILL